MVQRRGEGKLTRLLCSAVIALSACACVSAPASHETVAIKVIAFNDFHGRLQATPYVPTAGPPAIMAGGIDYLAAYVAYLKNQNPNHVVVAAGDLVGASPLNSAFYHDEATIEAMNLLGLDLSAVGNHEFDKGPAELLRKQNGGCFPSGLHTCLGEPFDGARFQYLAANVRVAASGQPLLPAYAIRNFQGVQVAFIGVGLADTPSIVTPLGVEGLEFEDEAATVNALIPEIQARGVHAIVVLIHQGGVQSPDEPVHSAPINECEGLLGGPVQSPIVAVVAHLSDAVDAVITGHTHKPYVCRLPNNVGRAIPVTQADYYGRVLTDIDLSVDRGSGRIVEIAASNLIVSHPAADALGSPVHASLSLPAVNQIRSVVARYDAAVAPLASQAIGRIAAPLSNVPNANGEEAAGDLIADSELAATQALPMGGAVMAFVNQGGVRPPGFDTAQATYPHDVTYEEAFAVRPFGNSLVTLTLTSAEIKDLLEQQFAGCRGQTVDKVLQLSSALHLEWSASNAPCDKIVNVSLQPSNGGAIDILVEHGVIQHPTRPYRVTVDSYLASGGDGFRVLSEGKDRLGGAQDIDALVGYLSTRYLAPNLPYDPTAPSAKIPRRVRLP